MLLANQMLKRSRSSRTLRTSVRLRQDDFERSLYFFGLRKLRVAFSTIVGRLKEL